MLIYENYLEKLKSIKLVSIDVDGTMTDGYIYYANDGSESRRYNVKDGIGIFLLQAANLKTAMMTTGHIDAIRLRGEKLLMDYVEIGIFDKAKRLKEICNELQIDMSEVAHLGDDINDVPAFEEVGLSVIVADSAIQAEAVADYKLKAKGGLGAIREFAEDYYKSMGKDVNWDIVETYIQQKKSAAQHNLSNG